MDFGWVGGCLVKPTPLAFTVFFLVAFCVLQVVLWLTLRGHIL